MFAKLVTQGVDHGVHAFYVPLRDAEGAFLPGVGGEDDGYKGGLNGIDNGRLHFDHVRVPRTNLLNRYGDVAEDGTYSSPIASPGRRFFTMLGTLVQGRSRSTAPRWWRRRSAADRPHLRRAAPAVPDRGRHRGRAARLRPAPAGLIPRLATVFAQSFAHEKLLRTFDDVFSGREDTPQRREDLETQAAAFKSMSTWSALDTLQECREACGGAGFLAENRSPASAPTWTSTSRSRATTPSCSARRQATAHRLPRAGAEGPGVDREVRRGQAATSSPTRPVSGASVRPSPTRFPGGVRHGPAGRQDPARAAGGPGGHHGHRDRLRLASAGKDRARGALLLNRSQHELIEAAKAHAELMQWEAFTEAIDEVPEGDTRRVLVWLRDLFALGLLEQHLDWYLMHGASRHSVPGRCRRTSTDSSPACGRSSRSCSTRSATSPATCARRSPSARSRPARTRPVSGSRPSSGRTTAGAEKKPRP